MNGGQDPYRAEPTLAARSLKTFQGIDFTNFFI
jgi:hypothetical protein